MSVNRRSGTRAKAAVFAALGDETRLALLAKLCSGQRYSIAELTQGTKLTRQAVTKHLRVLERVRMVHGTHAGRENLFVFDPQPVHEMKEYLEMVSQQWDVALARLKTFVETTRVSTMEAVAGPPDAEESSASPRPQRALYKKGAVRARYHAST